MHCAARTDTGRVRKANEDSFALDAELGLFVVADGMGGMAHGEVASRLAADAMFDGLKSRCDPVLGPVNTTFERILEELIELAHQRVVAENHKRPRFDGMGTTLIGAVIDGGMLHFAHSGDSRIYLCPQSRPIRQLTHDQTLEQDMLRRGLDRELAARRSHILTHYIGVEGALSPQLGHHPLDEPSTLILCTDGLSDMLPDAEIGDIVDEGGADVDVIADTLVAEANARGGRDNITVIVIQPDPSPPDRDTK